MTTQPKVKREAELQTAVMQFLSARGIFHWRMSVGPVIHRFGHGSSVKEVWKKNPLKGFPDVAGVLTRTHPGRLFTLEFKRPKGRVTPEQVAWMDRLQRAGCACAVVRSIDDVYAFFVRWGEL